MQVFVVLCLDEDCPELVGVFDTKEKADEVCARRNAPQACERCNGSGWEKQLEREWSSEDPWVLVPRKIRCLLCNGRCTFWPTAYSEVAEVTLNEEKPNE